MIMLDRFVQDLGDSCTRTIELYDNDAGRPCVRDRVQR
jgi:hypothetical protein